jgi:predicted dehydrogenase
MHLPNLVTLHDRFELVAISDPSQRVRETIGGKFGVRKIHADYRHLLEDNQLDAVIVCSPHGTHTEIVLAALDAGCHVLVEKPMCITLEDADTIVAERDRTGLIVQVATMKRYDPAYRRLLSDLPSTAEALRYISVVVNDPEVDPYFAPWEIVRGTDVPETVLLEARQSEADQVETAVGSRAPEVVWAFSYAFLGSLLHDVNAVHGLLEKMQEPLPASVVGGAWWAGGTAVSGAVRLSNGARWDSAHIPLLGTAEYCERISLFFHDSIQTLVFPSPWLVKYPTLYTRSVADGRASVVSTYAMHEESFVRELESFYDCVRGEAQCETPPEKARTDIEVITAMFLASA